MTVAHVRHSLRLLLRSLIYRTAPGAVVQRAHDRCTAQPQHETAEYWNQELAGRMAEPNINGKIGNAIRDRTTITLIDHCGATPHRVLDLGCSYGRLARLLQPLGLEQYLGVDLSDYVINRARREHRDLVHAALADFIVADLRDLTPPQEQRYDVMVFNEVLFYLTVDDAAAQLQRYRRWLAPDGLFIVTMYNDPKSEAIFHRLCAELEWIYGIVYQQHAEGPHYRVTRKRATPAYLTGALRPRIIE